MAKHSNLQLSSKDENETLEISVHKFGGSSLASAELLKNAVEIIKNYTTVDDFIVVSANGDITDWLIEYIDGSETAIARISQYYGELVTDLIEQPGDLLTAFSEDLKCIESSYQSEEAILSFGEVWSARLLTELLNQQQVSALFTDARQLFRTESIDNYHDFDAGYFHRGLKRHQYGNFKKRLIITGFIASNRAGQTVTLGRNGSDYSATLLAYFIRAKSVTLWTDVCGIYSADPRLIEQATPIEHLSYEEARALASVGTNVLHQKTIGPLQQGEIPLWVKSAFQPEKNGTEVGKALPESHWVSSVALKDKLIKLEISISNHEDRKQLCHELFENHIVAIQDESTAQADQLGLFVAQECLAKTVEFLVTRQFTYKIFKTPRTLIAIIGNKVALRKPLIDRFESSLASRFDFRYLAKNSSHIIQIITNEPETSELLSNFYSICHQSNIENIQVDAGEVNEFDITIGVYA